MYLQNLTKKYRLYAACGDFPFIQLLNSRAMKDAKEQAFFCKDVVRTAMEELRAPIDALEMIVDKDVWPVPSYGELTFEV